MPFRKQSQPKLTGADFLIGVAEAAAQQGRPFAEDFRDMIADCFMGSDALPAVHQARRPLDEHEAAPVGIILGAMEAARQSGDRESLEEVVKVGASLLAKWPYYLLSRVDGHPDLTFRDR